MPATSPNAPSKMHSLKRADRSLQDPKTILPAGYQKRLAKNHQDENLVITLLIVRTGLIDYHFRLVLFS